MKKALHAVKYIFVSGLLFWTLFYNLGKWPFRVWDESRLITSAYEMTKNHKYISPTIDNAPDLWNCKPPLMIWAEALCIKIFGFCEWSARLPAALCGLITVIMTAVFIRKLTSDKWVWIVPVIVLCTSGGLIGYHAARYGEYDAMLTLFTTSYLLSFFVYTESIGSKRNKYLILFFILLTLACLTKGIAGLLFAPALFIYVLLRKQLFCTLSNRFFYIGLVVFLLLVPGYYLLREQFNQGYIQSVWDNELGGRFNTTLGGEEKPWNMYLQAITFNQFSTWYWALPTSLILFGFLSNYKLFRTVVFCWLNLVVFLAVISMSKTKMWWYDLPVFPLMAIIVSIVIFQLSNFVSALPLIKRQVATVVLIIIFSIQPLTESSYFLLHQYNDDLQTDNFYAPSYYFLDAIKGKKDLNGTIYLSCCYNIQWRLYVKWLDEIGVRIEDHPFLDNRKFKVGDKVIANQAEMKEEIEKNYNYTLVEEYYGVKNYLVTSVK